MKKLVVMLFLAMLVGCGQTFEEKDLKFVGNTVIEGKYDKQVAVFEDKDGSVVSLFWDNIAKPLEKGATYKVEYQTNDNYTTYLNIINYDKQ